MKCQKFVETATSGVLRLLVGLFWGKKVGSHVKTILCIHLGLVLVVVVPLIKHGFWCIFVEV